MRYENTGATESSDDYLEAILVIRAERGRCRNVDIAEHMGVTKPSVTKALANLAQKGLVDVVDRDARLTSEGRRLAEETLAKHRFFEGMLSTPGWMRKSRQRRRAAWSTAYQILPSVALRAILRTCGGRARTGDRSDP